MSAIYKLSIQGIRSFDSNDRETIEFGKPLTLIVGSNGSGKTTIIECLKYATSGDLPPNSKGGAFVHDPKITGEKDVRAQVKLAFTSANALNMIVTRNIQLLVKKTAATFKTLEGQLVIVNSNGGRNTLSTRSIELDTQVPLYMGVPKAILEYVIFCHQEDSLWPLSEPSNLKKKFDEIFQAMKFTKALDNLKGIKKDMSVDIKLLKQSVEHLKVDKDRSETVKLEMRQLETKVEKYKSEVKEIEKRILIVNEQSDKLFKSNQDFQRVLSKAENLKHNRESMRDQISRLSSAIDILDIPRAELLSRIKNFSFTLEEKEVNTEAVRADITSAKSKSLELHNKCNFLIRRQGELTAAKNTHEKNLKALNELHQYLSLKYPSCGKYNTNLRIFLLDLEKIKNSLNANFQKLSNEGKLELSYLEKQLSELRHSKIIQKERLEYSKQDEEKLIKEVDRLDTELQLSGFTFEDLEKEKTSLEKFQQKLHEWERKDDISKFNSDIKSKNDQMLILESEVEDIQIKISKTNQRADLFAKLSVIKRLMKEKEEELSTLKDKILDDENCIKWNISAESNVDVDFKKLSSKLTQETSLKEKKFRDKDREFTEASLNYGNIKQELKDLAEKRSNVGKILERNLPEDCPIEEYEEVVAETELSYRTALENLKMHQTTLAFNRRAIEVAQEESVCYLCSRKFEDKPFKSSLLKKLAAKIDVGFEKGLKETVENEKTYLQTLRSMEKNVVELRSCSEKVKSLVAYEVTSQERVRTLESERNSLSNEYLNLKHDLDFVEKDVRSLVDSVIRCKNELKDLKNDVKTLSDELALYGALREDIQTVDELQAQQKEKNDHLRMLRKDINQLQEKKEEKSREYSKLLTVVKERNLKVTEIEKELSMNRNIENDIEQKKKEIVYMKKSTEKGEKELEALTIKLVECEKIEHLKRKELESNMLSLSTNLKETEEDLEKFSGLKQALDGYASTGLEKLEECSNELDSCQKSFDQINKYIEKRNAELSNEIQKIRDSTNEKRSLEQNLQLCDLRANLERLEIDINEIDISNAENERDRYQEESLKLRNEYEGLSSDNAGKLGEIRQLQNQIESLSRQLRTEYEDVNNHYHKKWVELQTRTFVNDDIETYSKALDSAIMKYHGLKMQDINRIVDELWKRTYSGTDVDSIQIKSDEVKSGIKGKSYNYRVVMYKQDAELDMRGRCSAGQKVLASIIIRLALSETFGVNCGVIALDEPTTNLDEENIESLAKALNNIIHIRRHQKNFQLIVITHDEKFLNNMNASEFTDHFFRVKRDDRQKSQIERVDISRVTE